MANIMLNNLIEKKVKELLMDALFNENELLSCSAAMVLKDQKYIELVAKKSKHKLSRWVAIEKIEDKGFFQCYQPEDNDLTNVCNKRYAHL